MNYFGHAVIAHRVHQDPAFVLGAMLPDLVQLTGARLDLIDDAAITQGIEFHHRTDALFHASPTFIGLCRDALSAARDVGVRKGPARGMTHLVVELIIDAHLAEVPTSRSAYMTALAHRPAALAEHPHLVEGLDWLHARGPGVHNATPERLTTVLSSALGRRARLEPTEAELHAALSAWRDLPARVRAELPSLMFDMDPLFQSTSEGFGASFFDLRASASVTSPP